jgi:hypothetical protein
MFSFPLYWVNAQNIICNESLAATERLKNHVFTLSHDSLQGRESGTEFERIAARYIAENFKSHGLKPFFGDTSFFQEFPLRQRVYLYRENSLNINNVSLRQNLDFFPILFSTPDVVSGKVVFSDIDSPPDSCIWMFILKFPKSYSDSSIEAKSDFICKKTKDVSVRGISGIVMIGDTDSLNYNPLNLLQRKCVIKVPAVFVQSSKLNTFSLHERNHADIKLQFYRTTYNTGINVSGFIDNNATHTVVVGAHYDHVGLGFFGSLSKQIAIHNGADDNASGTAALLELSYIMKQEVFRKYNYLFVAFGGEECGMLGSDYFLLSVEGSRLKYNCMINIDMVGKINNKNPVLFMVAAGSSNSWKKIDKTLESKNPQITRVRFTFPHSDHAGFINRKIPAVQFFTGLHSDYHTPDDIASKINYQGMEFIVNYIYHVLLNIENRKTLKYRNSKFWESYKREKQLLMQLN